MTDKLNMEKPVNNERLQIKTVLSQLDSGFAIVALFSAIITALDYFLFGLNIHLPCFFYIFIVLAFICTPLATIALLIAIPFKWSKSSNYENFARLGLLGTMLFIIASLVIFHLPNFLTNYGMRLLVEHHGGINNLVQWADVIMEKPFETVVTNPSNAKYGVVKTKLFSDQVNKIERYTTLVTRKQGKCIVVETGGGGFIEFGWGVVVTSQDMQINNYPQTNKLFKWQDRVYGYIGNEWKLLFGPDEEGQ